MNNLTILNTVLPKKKNFRNSINALYGIGGCRADKLASLLGVHPYTKIDRISQNKLNKITAVVEKSFLIDFELRRKISLNISTLRTLKTWRGYRLAMGLPTRGQRTHTNASTVKRLIRNTSINKTLDLQTFNKNKNKFNFKNKKLLKIKSKSKSNNKNKNKKK